jgi:uncharacterized iron-regulated membrane protein
MVSVPIRHALVRTHRYVGLAIAGFLIVAGLTGAVIPFHHELDRALNPALFSARQGDRLTPSTLAEAVERTDPSVRVVFVETNADAGRSAMLFVEPRAEGTRIPYNQIFSDPTTGAVLGRRQYGACCLQPENLIPFLYNVHRRLAMPGHWGDWLMGAVSLLWTLDCFVALMLTFPRTNPFLRKWASAWKIKKTSSSHRKTSDLHRAGGLWFWLVMLPIALSGVYLNLGSELFRPVVAIFSPLTPTPYDSRPPAAQTADVEDNRLSFDAVLARASDYATDRKWPYRVRGIYDDRNAGFFVVDFGTGREAGLGTPWLYIDAATGAVLSEEVPGAGTVGDVIVRTQFPIHSGRILGLPGRVLVSLTGLIVVVLSITGIVIWYRKRTLRVRRAWPPSRGPRPGPRRAA